MCKQPLTLLHPLTCLHLCDVDEVVFGRRGQHLPIMAEAEGSHRPIQSTPQQINTRERGGGRINNHGTLSRGHPQKRAPFIHVNSYKETVTDACVDTHKDCVDCDIDLKAHSRVLFLTITALCPMSFFLQQCVSGVHKRNAVYAKPFSRASIFARTLFKSHHLAV